MPKTWDITAGIQKNRKSNLYPLKKNLQQQQNTDNNPQPNNNNKTHAIPCFGAVFPVKPAACRRPDAFLKAAGNQVTKNVNSKAEQG